MFKFKAFQVPTNYTFQDPDSGIKFIATTKKELVTRIINYRAQNGYPPIEYLADVLENYWCMLPENTGKCERTKLKRGLVPMLKGAVFVIKNIFYGKDNLTDLATATKRAKICLNCPHNVNPDIEDPRSFDKWADEIAIHSTGDAYKQMPLNERKKLFNCEICTCPLRAKVWYKGNLDLSEEEISKLPKFCWQLELIKEKSDGK